MESNQRHCKDCKTLKTRIEDGKFNDKDKRFIDEHKKLWNGNVCPDCVVKQSRKRMKYLRELRKIS